MLSMPNAVSKFPFRSASDPHLRTITHVTKAPSKGAARRALNLPYTQRSLTPNAIRESSWGPRFVHPQQVSPFGN